MIFSTKLLAAALTTASLLAASLPAQAGLIGSTVSSQYFFNGQAYNNPQSFTADGGAHANFFNYFQVEVTDHQVIFDYSTFNGSASWNNAAGWSSGGLYIESGNLLNFIGAPDIHGVTLDAASNMAGFNASRITFDHDSIAVNWAGLSFSNGTRVVLDIDAGTVPEPASYALVAIALAGLGLAKRRKA